MVKREKLEKERLEKAKAKKRGRRICVGMLTSGGDCQALDTTMCGITRALYNLYDSMDIIGFRDGYRGLMYEDYRLLLKNDFSDILTQGSTLLGTNRQPFKQITQPDENGNDRVELMKVTYRKLELDCLCVLGGNGSQKTTNLLRQEGLNIVSLPKTISNGLFGTGETFGFQSAVEITSNVVDCIHTTAASHSRVFIVEVMEHKVGWFTLHAGITGGVGIILIPEILYDIKVITKALQKRQRAGNRFSIIVVAENAILKETTALSKKERKTKLASRRYPSVAYEIGAKIRATTEQEVHVTVPGHTQYSGTSNPYDCVLSSYLGARAVRLINEGRFDEMVVIRNSEITSIPLKESAGKLRIMDPNSSIIGEAKFLGLSFGDR